MATGQPQRGLTGATELARVYDAIFDARFRDVPVLRSRACALRPAQGVPSESRGGPAPPEACQVLDALDLWWQIQLDPYDTSRDAAFLARADAAIAATSAWTDREPERA